MRLPSLGVLTVVALASLSGGCPSPAQPAYADITYQTRCVHLDGTPITGCNPPPSRDIYGFSGDMGQRFSCTISEHAGMRGVNFTVAAHAADGTPIGVSLQNATVPAAGGAVQGTCQFTWTDGNTFGGNCGAVAPSASQPCQIRSVEFTTDTATGLPLMNVDAYCLDAPSIPPQSPAVLRSVSAAGAGTESMMPFTIHFYSCPVVVR
jgi:hypothetical protein